MTREDGDRKLRVKVRLGGKRKPSMVCTPVICVLRRQREEGCYKFMASLVAIIRSRLARARSQIKTKQSQSKKI